MAFPANSIGKYKIGRTIGEGSFAKVKLAVDSTNGQYVAIKTIDKHKVMESDLKYQAYFHFLSPFFLSPPSLEEFVVFLLSHKLVDIPSVSGKKRNKNNEAAASPKHRTDTWGVFGSFWI